MIKYIRKNIIRILILCIDYKGNFDNCGDMEKVKLNGIGQRLKEIRRKAKLTQKDVAEEFGCAQATISAIENEDTSPSLEFLIWLARKTNTPVVQLLFGEDTDVETAHIHKEPVERNQDDERLYERIRLVVEAYHEFLVDRDWMPPPDLIAKQVADIYRKASEKEEELEWNKEKIRKYFDPKYRG